MGINPHRLIIGSDILLSIEVPGVACLMSRSLAVHEENLDQIREHLCEYAKPLCRSAGETPLPPLHAINHEIPLIDHDRIYPWHPSWCPEALRDQWAAKKEAYIQCGQWKVTSSGNTVPMLLIWKPGKEGEPLHLCTVVDLRVQNVNTHKCLSLLPDMDGILR